MKSLFPYFSNIAGTQNIPDGDYGALSCPKLITCQELFLDKVH